MLITSKLLDLFNISNSLKVKSLFIMNYGSLSSTHHNLWPLTLQDTLEVCISMPLGPACLA